jgi:hypothetical protein
MEAYKKEHDAKRSDAVMEIGEYRPRFLYQTPAPNVDCHFRLGSIWQLSVQASRIQRLSEAEGNLWSMGLGSLLSWVESRHKHWAGLLLVTQTRKSCQRP